MVKNSAWAALSASWNQRISKVSVFWMAFCHLFFSIPLELFIVVNLLSILDTCWLCIAYHVNSDSASSPLSMTRSHFPSFSIAWPRLTTELPFWSISISNSWIWSMWTWTMRLLWVLRAPVITHIARSSSFSALAIDSASNALSTLYQVILYC